MKIIRITRLYRNDFTAILECEHCGKTQPLDSGYNDDFYHSRVIPSIACLACNLDRAGRPSTNDGNEPVPEAAE